MKKHLPGRGVKPLLSGHKRERVSAPGPASSMGPTAVKAAQLEVRGNLALDRKVRYQGERLNSIENLKRFSDGLSGVGVKGLWRASNMKRPVIACFVLALSGTGLTYASVSPTGGSGKAGAVSAKARVEAAALKRAQNRAAASFKKHQAHVTASEKKKAAETARMQARAAKQVKADAAALSRAYDRAVANHKRYVSRRLAAEKLSREKTAAAEARVARRAKLEAEALSRAQDRVVAYLRGRLRGDSALAKAMKRIEKLACFTGVQDRHARIGVKLVDGKVDYFAYYSKWKPRTCSIAAGRDGAYSHWEDKGEMSTVTLVDDKGTFTINRKGGSVRFVFHDIDRMRYCGMSGKINGSLTVMRGKSKCVLDGVMDNHDG